MQIFEFDLQRLLEKVLRGVEGSHRAVELDKKKGKLSGFFMDW